MKKALSLLLCLCMAVTMLSGLTLAADGLTLTVDTPTAAPGRTVEVPLTLSGNPGIASLCVRISYDKSVLTLQSAEFDPTFKALGTASNVSTESDDIGLVWISFDHDAVYDGVIATLTFTVRGDVPDGFTPITVSYYPEDFYNIDEEDVPLTVEDGGVDVQPAPVIGPMTLTVDQRAAYPGETVTVPLTLLENPGFASLRIRIDYDKSVLTLKSAAFEPAFQTLGSTAAVSTENDFIGMVWVSSDDVTYNGVIANLTFTVQDSAPAGFTPITVSFDQYDFYNAREEEVLLTTEDGGVDVRAVPIDPMLLTVGQPEAEPGETVEVPLTLSENPGIASIRLSIAYDRSVLAVQSAAFDPTFRSRGLISAVNTEGDDIVLVWISDGDVDYNGVIATLTFTVQEDAPEAFTPITVSYDPSDLYNNDDVEIPLTSEDGGVDVHFFPIDPMTVTVGQAEALLGQTVTVPLTFSGNPGIASLKLNVSYDDSALSLVSAELDPAYAGFSGAVTAVNTKANPLVLLWLAPDGEVTADGAFAALTFRIKESAPEALASISVSYDQEDVYNSKGRSVPLIIEDGGINVKHYPAGDITMDGKVNNKDLTALARHLAGYTITCLSSYLDTNGDGKVNNKDLTRLAQYLAGKSVELFHGPVNATPLSVSITAPSSGTTSSPLSFSANITGGKAPYNIKWYAAKSSDSSWGFVRGTAANFSPTFTSAGTWQVLCDVTDANGTNVYRSATFTITAPTLSVTLPSSSLSKNVASHYQPTVSGGSGSYTYSWSWSGAGSGTSSGSYLNVYGWKTGSYSVTVTVTDNSTGATSTATASLTIGNW